VNLAHRDQGQGSTGLDNTELFIIGNPGLQPILSFCPLSTLIAETQDQQLVFRVEDLFQFPAKFFLITDREATSEDAQLKWTTISMKKFKGFSPTFWVGDIVRDNIPELLFHRQT
jgi:hypothetical protein